MELTWVIEWMTVSTKPIEGLNEVVLTAGWRLNGVDGDVSTSVYGSVSFPQPEVDGEFTPYADLTQEQVLGWVWDNGIDKDTTEASVTSQLETLKNPPTENPPLPWTPAEPTPEVTVEE